MIPPPAAPEFLAAHGWGDAEILPLAGDASFRRYFRVVAPDRQAVLMDAPPEHEDIRPFLKIARHLVAQGHSAPRDLAVDLDRGLLLLEDFGDRLVGPELARDPLLEETVYTDALSILDQLHRAAPPEGVAPYDAAVLHREVDLLIEWYAPAIGSAVDAAGFHAAWDAVFPAILAGQSAHPVLVLRDYHADNLMLLDRPGTARLGLLDFQDALVGHAAYDLVSLLQDARRDVSPALEEAMLHRWSALTGCDAEAFRAQYEILGAQRNTKIVGIFARLWQRDGKPRYLDYLPRVWGYLERNLAHPALAPVASWFDANIPPELRGPAWKQSRA